MRFITPSKVRGYIVVHSGINPLIDSPTIFKDVTEWRRWCGQMNDVALVDLITPAGDTGDGLSLEVPRQMWLGLGLRFFWRAVAWWHNRKRRAYNKKEAERQREFYSQEGIDKRVKARQS